MWGTPGTCWVVDWCKDSGRWNLKTPEDVLIRRFDSVSIRTESELVVVNGGRHGYLVTAGVVREDSDGGAIITEE